MLNNLMLEKGTWGSQGGEKPGSGSHGNLPGSYKEEPKTPDCIMPFKG